MQFSGFLKSVAKFAVVIIWISSCIATISEDYETSGYVHGDMVHIGGALENAKTLLKNKLANYDTRLRPRLNQSDSVVVSAKFIPNAIVNFDVTGQKIDVIGFFRISWIDEVLTWNASAYGDTSIIMLPLKNIWYPKLIVDRAYSNSGNVGERSLDIVRIDNNGLARWVPNGYYSFICDVDVTFYPNDIQQCEMQFYVTDQRTSEVELQTSREVNLNNYSENAEWRLVKVISSTAYIYGTNIVSVTFHLERRSSFTFYTIVLPLFTLSLLSIFTFLVPVECGEKGSLSITIFLAYGFFIAITRDSLPHNSVQIPYFVGYICVLLLMSVLTVLYVMIETKVHYTIGTRPCSLQLSRLTSMLPKSIKIGELTSTTAKGKEGPRNKSDHPEKKQEQKLKNKDMIGKDSARHVVDMTNKQNECDKVNQYTWADFLRMLNTVVFCGCLMFLLIFSAVTWAKILNRKA